MTYKRRFSNRKYGSTACVVCGDVFVKACAPQIVCPKKECKLKRTQQVRGIGAFERTCEYCGIVFKTSRPLQRCCCKRHGQYMLVKRRYQESLEQKRERGRNRHWERTLRLRYKITQATYDEMREAQDYRCGICDRPENASLGRAGRLVLDHDHASGKLRAFLCPSCNMGLGMFKDDPDLMRKAADYAMRHADAILSPEDLVIQRSEELN